jgi:hypothetical protein
MESNINNKKTEQDEKHSGGWHIFLFMGGALVILILIKVLLDKYLN